MASITWVCTWCSSTIHFLSYIFTRLSQLYHSFRSEENHSNTQRSNAHSNVTRKTLTPTLEHRYKTNLDILPPELQGLSGLELQKAAQAYVLTQKITLCYCSLQRQASTFNLARTHKTNTSYHSNITNIVKHHRENEHKTRINTDTLPR